MCNNSPGTNIQNKNEAASCHVMEFVLNTKSLQEVEKDIPMERNAVLNVKFLQCGKENSVLAAINS